MMDTRPAAVSDASSQAETTAQRSRRVVARQSTQAWWVCVGLTTVAFVLVLSPLLDGAYGADDIWYSQLPGRLDASGQSFVSYVVEQTEFWMKDAGRFFPGTIASTSAIFLLIPDRESYKVFQLGVAVLAVASVALSFGYLVRNRWLGLLIAGAMCALLQFRLFFDALQFFNGQQSLVVIGITSTMFALTAYARTGRRSCLLAASVSWSLTLITYESAFLLSPILLLTMLLASTSWHQRLTALSWIAVPTVALGLLIVWLRASLQQPPAPGYTINTQLTEVAPTMLKQLTATIPLSENLLGGQQRLTGLTVPVTLRAWAILLVVACVVWVAVRHIHLDRRTSVLLTAMGGLLLVVPAALVAITVRWQQELTWGQGYIAVYIQSFGLAVLFSVLLCAVVNRLLGSTDRVVHRSGAVLLSIVAVVAGLTAGSVTENNARVVATTDLSLGFVAQQPLLGWSREVTDAALRRGVLGEAFAGRPLAAVPGAPWLNSDYLTRAAGQQVRVTNAWAPFTDRPVPRLQLRGCPLEPGPCDFSAALNHVLYVTANAYDSGLLAVGKIARARQRSAVPNNIDMTLVNARIYLQSPHIEPGADVKLCNTRLAGVEQVPLVMVARADDWAIFETPGSTTVSVQDLGLLADQTCLSVRTPLAWDSAS